MSEQGISSASDLGGAGSETTQAEGAAIGLPGVAMHTDTPIWWVKDGMVGLFLDFANEWR